MNYEQEFIDACNKSTDINEHLPRLSELASECKQVTELGVGWAQSTRAFLRHGNELHSYEFDPLPGVMEFFVNARKGGRDVKFHVADTRKVVIHVYEQVKEELRLHADKARKYIGFHDTTSYEFNGEFGGKGIWPAIQEFIDSHSEWKMIERRYNNNGLTILQRV